MPFPPWPADQVARYTAYRTTEPITIDGQLDEYGPWHTFHRHFESPLESWNHFA